ncbi:DNA-binding transcriptional LysR family regulator [Isoptericola sp. CG 20/1183]|uniref:DNA-binding transcriptional LysR family regulator n=1 Tax=Isoptericola halotolerans TaxID=300560 RepID=A0ABX5ECA3_9MICO|nr:MULTISPECIES: LysR family transcriptional regulator [Isoptericola]PRZ05202.1 DNA-binding transcriptional LysR family regulator [Isoptericola halotolerans]PRZ05940.1 DNA-binding transcriptional LysR family regulator [Isoptericola sp. CG 20/1183]
MVDRTSLTSLELLVAVDTYGSISGAARALGVAQPTASSGLRRLERRLGLELVTRGARGTALTPTGQAAAGWAREVVEASQRFETAAAGLRAGPTTALRVAASLTVAEYLVPRWLAQLAAQGAAADVELLVRNSHDVMELVLDGGAQLGFVESLGVRRGLRSRTVARDELLAVVAPGHPWARRRSVGPGELLGARLVLRETGSGTREILERALTAVGETLPAHLPTFGSTSALKAAVQHGGQVAVLSGLTVADDVAAGRLVALGVDGLDLTRRLRVVWRDGVTPSAAARRLSAVARGTPS